MVQGLQNDYQDQMGFENPVQSRSGHCFHHSEAPGQDWNLALFPPRSIQARDLRGGNGLN